MMNQKRGSKTLAIMLVASSVSKAFGDIIKVPIQRMPKIRTQGVESSIISTAAAPRAEELMLQNHMNSAYYGTLEVGTPPQAIWAMFDTGSSDMWFPTLAGASGKATHYEPNASSTSNDLGLPFEISYVDGPVAGKLFTDVVKLGSVELANFTFAAVDDTSGLVGEEALPFDGMLGLGFPGLSTIQGETFLEALFTRGKINSMVFGFYVGQNEPGQLVIGGVDPDHIASEFDWVPVTKPLWWTIELDEIRANGKRPARMGLEAIVDSGTALISGPSSQITTLMNLLGATKYTPEEVPDMDLFKAPCSEVPNMSVTFTIGGKDYTLVGEDLVVQRLDGGFCDLGFSTAAEDEWTLGDVFMRKFYVQFDFGRKRLGFALAKREGDNLV